ncbi:MULTISPECIES: hypothetical protein [unclassified Afipia]|uniref:hypothetical protein n=1 Tax=unclassified Afipia TaxID=2642050 RepID=UPI00178C3C2B|nr:MULTISPECIES: hypothetical protein [unclassified Afipia]
MSSRQFSTAQGGTKYVYTQEVSADFGIDCRSWRPSCRNAASGGGADVKSLRAEGTQGRKPLRTESGESQESVRTQSQGREPVRGGQSLRAEEEVV